MRHEINHEDALSYIFAGNAIFTCENEMTGNRFTWKVKRGAGKWERVYFVHVLGGGYWKYLGCILDDVFRPRVSGKSVDGLEYVLNKLHCGNLEDNMKIYHYNTCGRCGKLLTVPDSVMIGFGKDCVKKASALELKKMEKQQINYQYW